MARDPDLPYPQRETRGRSSKSLKTRDRKALAETVAEVGKALRTIPEGLALTGNLAWMTWAARPQLVVRKGTRSATVQNPARTRSWYAVPTYRGENIDMFEFLHSDAWMAESEGLLLLSMELAPGGILDLITDAGALALYHGFFNGAEFTLGGGQTAIAGLDLVKLAAMFSPAAYIAATAIVGAAGTATTTPATKVYAKGLFVQMRTETYALDATLQAWIDAGHIQEPPETAGRGSADSVPTPLDGLLNGEIAKRWVSAFGHACFLTALLRGRMQRESD